jgi:FkbM family methyltransferase
MQAILNKIYKKTLRLLGKEEIVDFGDFKLTINPHDSGGVRYCDDLNYWSDLIDPLQKEIIDLYNPTIFLDIGANYGFTSILHFSKNPNCLIIAVEASPLLANFLSMNFKQNGCKNYILVSSVCSDQQSENYKFSLNPLGSQDNRVVGSKGWKSVNVSSTTINHLLQGAKSTDFIMIKIDTQGFEEKVFYGGESFLLNNDNWVIKTEFAPNWLISQGTDPTLFLEYLIDKYLVTELPKRSRFKGDSIISLNKNTLKKEECFDFVNYTKSLAKEYGWCDLLISPRHLKH